MQPRPNCAGGRQNASAIGGNTEPTGHTDKLAMLVRALNVDIDTDTIAPGLFGMAWVDGRLMPIDLALKRLATGPVEGNVDVSGCASLTHLPDGLAVGGTLRDATALKRLGLEVLDLSVLAIKPKPETARALEAEAREALLRRADEAIYARRNAAVEQERAIKENELNTEIAVENKQRQIKEAQMDADRAVAQRRRLIEQEDMNGKIVLEQRNRDLMVLVAENMREEADARAYGLDATMKAFSGADSRVLQSLVAVNPDPNRWDGVLLPFSLPDLGRVVADELAGRRRVKMVTMAKACLNNGQTLYAVNDLFVGPRSHVSARYVIEVGGRAERQSSSGVIISTGLGSTGWLKSIYAGWASMTDALMPGRNRAAVDGSFAWDRVALHYFVREPFPSRTTQTALVLGQVEGDDVLRLHSEMAENGVIFSDGVEADFLEFNSGSVATIGVAERQGMLVV